MSVARVALALSIATSCGEAGAPTERAPSGASSASSSSLASSSLAASSLAASSVSPAVSASATAEPRGALAGGERPIVARRARLLPIVSSPDPLFAAPMPRPLDPSIACATPRVPGRALPGGASPLHVRLYAACKAALVAPSVEVPASTRACRELAAILASGHGGPDDALFAVSLDARVCALGDQAACADLGSAILSGYGAVFDPACGDAVLSYACDHGGASACARRGRLARLGDRVPFDPRRGDEALARGCDLGDPTACLAVAASVRRDDPARALELEKKALARDEIACRDGEGDACADLAWAYRKDLTGGPFSASFRATIVDADRAETFAVLACRTTSRSGCFGRRDVVKTEEAACREGDFERCIDVAFEHVNASGRGGGFAPADDVALRAACLGGSTRGCWALGDRATPSVLDEACSAGVLTACRPQGRGTVPLARTDALRKKGCEQGSATDCRELGEAAIRAGDVAAGITLLERACPSIRYTHDQREIDAIACAEAGRRRRTGDGVERDTELALELLSNGCFAEGRSNPRGEGCVELADMFDRGDGVARDAERARDLRAGACEATRKGCEAFEPQGEDAR